MSLTLSLTNALAKQRLLTMLRDLGHRATSGQPSRTHRFTVRVSGIDPADLASLHAVVRRVDPGAYGVGLNTDPALLAAS